MSQAIAPSTWRRALITGASTGIGAAFADALARAGADLVLVARDRGRLERRAAELRSTYGIQTEVLVADLTRAADLRRVEARLEDTRPPIDLLVNNAGSETEHAPFLERDRDLLEAEASVNALALMRLTHAAATTMAAAGRGNIVNVSAGVAFYPAPGSAAYAASKAFVNSISVAVAHELRGTGVAVTAVCPGFTPTAAQARLGLHVEWVPSLLATPATKVADTALRAARSRRTLVSSSFGDAIVCFLGRHMPTRVWLPAVARIQARLAGPCDIALVDLIADDSRPRRVGGWLGRLVELPAVGRPLARALRSPMHVRSATTRWTRLHALLLRRSGGRLRRSWTFAAGQPVLSLTTIGRTSGLRRSTTVACFSCDGELAVAAMNLGSARNPSWALNLQANPNATITLAGRTIDVIAEHAVGETAQRVWHRWVEVQPSAQAFRDLSGRDVPLFVLRADPANEPQTSPPAACAAQLRNHGTDPAFR